jgi:hypothetical protein
MYDNNLPHHFCVYARREFESLRVWGLSVWGVLAMTDYLQLQLHASMLMEIFMRWELMTQACLLLYCP